VFLRDPPRGTVVEVDAGRHHDRMGIQVNDYSAGERVMALAHRRDVVEGVWNTDPSSPPASRVALRIRATTRLSRSSTPGSPVRVDRRPVPGRGRLHPQELRRGARRPDHPRLLRHDVAGPPAVLGMGQALPAGFRSSGISERGAGCSTRASTRLAMKRAVRTTLPPRVTSDTVTTLRRMDTSTRRPARVALTSYVLGSPPASTTISTLSPFRFLSFVGSVRYGNSPPILTPLANLPVPPLRTVA